MPVAYRVKSKTGDGKITTHSTLFSGKMAADRFANTLIARNPSGRTKAWSVKITTKKGEKPPKVIKKTIAQIVKKSKR